LRPDEKISPTAHYTAYVWYRLGLPYSELFATARGAALFWGLRLSLEWMALASRRVPVQAMHLEARHRTLDHQLALLGPDRVVEIGAGLSRRGVTWAADHAVPYTEVDLPPIIKAKQAILDKAPAGLRHRIRQRLDFSAMSIRDARFAEWLGEKLQGARRPVVIAEGLLVYFDLPERIRMASGIRRALQAAGGGHFLCDLPLRETDGSLALASTVRKTVVRLITAGRGVGEFPSRQVAREFMVAAGFNGIRQLPNAIPSTIGKIHLPARIWLGAI
jgi:O-methyltransferase involved in polyketide biosynthesis